MPLYFIGSSINVVHLHYLELVLGSFWNCVLVPIGQCPNVYHQLLCFFIGILLKY